jgi:hypothetical protein
MQVSVRHFETQAQPILAPAMPPWPRSSDQRRAEWLAVSDDKDKPLSVAFMYLTVRKRLIVEAVERKSCSMTYGTMAKCGTPSR